MTEPIKHELSVVFPPQPGESFDGYLTRNLAKAPIRNRRAVLSILGVREKAIAPGMLHKNPEALTAIATLLGQPEDTIAHMNMRSRTRTRGVRKLLVEFGGAWLDQNCILVNQRRVSVSSLRLAPIHRAIWTVGLLSLDGSTLEPLITHCPVCSHALGWRRAVRATHCDHCVDQRGRACVDLRDFPQTPRHLDHADGYRFISALLDPHSEFDAKSMMASEWQHIDAAVQLEVGLVIARWITFKQTLCVRLPDFSAEALQQITPEVIGEAGNYLRQGTQGLRQVQAKYLGNNGREAFGRAVSLHPHVSASAKELLAAVLMPSRKNLQAQGYVSLKWLIDNYKITPTVAEKISGLSPDCRGKGLGRLLIMNESTTAPIHAYRDRITHKQLRSAMGFNKLDIKDLLSLDILHPLDPTLLGERDFRCVTGSSLRAAKQQLEGLAAPTENAISFRAYLAKRHKLKSSGIVFAAVLRLNKPIAVLDWSSLLWIDAYGTNDIAAIDAAVHQLLEENPNLKRRAARNAWPSKNKSGLTQS